MLIVFSLLLAALALVALGYPILRSTAKTTSVPVVTSAEEALAELLAERAAAFQAIRDLQFDHEIGKISDEDFAVYETQLKAVAAESLRKLDAWETQMDHSLDSALERQVAARRAALNRTDSRTCSQCGRRVTADDRFCTGCGSALSAGVQAKTAAAVSCPKCGRAVSAGDRFCPKCGQALADLMRVAGNGQAAQTGT